VSDLRTLLPRVPAWLRSLCLAVAVGCIALAVYLAFDWADYGSDSTCGNLVTNRKTWADSPCADIMRHRGIGVIVLGACAVVLVIIAVARPRRADTAVR
jgi:hypothetical protein